MLVMNGMVASQQIRHMQVEGILTRHLPILGVSTNVRGAQGIILFEWSIVVSSPTDNWIYSPSNERLWNGMSLSIHNQYFPPLLTSDQDDVISKPFTINQLVRSATSPVNSQSVQDWGKESGVNLENVESVGVVIGDERSRKGSVTSYTTGRAWWRCCPIAWGFGLLVSCVCIVDEREFCRRRSWLLDKSDGIEQRAW